jgi:hypothetical protein
MSAVHEDYTAHVPVRGSSDRSFGFVFAAFFAIVGLLPILRHRGGPRWWACVLALGFAAVATIYPPLLSVPNRLWLRLGLLLNRIVSPIVMGLIFYCVFTPVGMLLRLRRRDHLRLRHDADAQSYWIHRQPPGPNPESLANQF